MLPGGKMLFDGKQMPKFLTWLQSDGNALVNTDFVLPSRACEITVIASMLSISNADLYFVGSGEPRFDSGIGWCWFGKHSDRQQVIYFGEQRWWNNPGNMGNYVGEDFHTIKFSQPVSGEAPILTLDGDIVPISNEGPAGLNEDIGSDPMLIFGVVGRVAGNVRIRQVSVKSPSGKLLCDFRASLSADGLGFYDLVSSKFCTAEGGDLISGRLITNSNGGGGINA